MYDFNLIVHYGDSSLDYRLKSSYRSEKKAQNARAKVTLADPLVSVVEVKQGMDLNSWDLSLPLK